MYSVINFLQSLRDGDTQLVQSTAFQTIINNVPPLTSVEYSLSPATGTYAQLMYSIVFGQSMMPHSIGAQIYQGGAKLFDAIVSGSFTEEPTTMFAFVTVASPVNVRVSNYRLLSNYYESTAMYLAINNEESFNKVLDALRRYGTSARSEELAAQSAALLNSILTGPREKIV